MGAARPAPATPTVPLLARYAAVRRATLMLAAPLDPEDCLVQTLPEVSPTKWHLAHVTWFFERFCLLEHAPGYVLYDERYDYLFNSYYEAVGPRQPRGDRGHLSRPLFREVLAYRAYVDDAMMALLDRRADDATLAARVVLGLHHEQQHQELLLTDIKHVFFSNPIGPAYTQRTAASDAPELAHVFVPQCAGTVDVGADGDGFAFDSERPRHEVLLTPHALGNRPVTNAEYLGFIEAGGYRDPRLWLADGWHLVERGRLSRPLYWSAALDREFTLAGWRPIDPRAPVCHVSYYEADAFARWAGGRLPREAEWEGAASGVPIAGNTLDTGLLQPRASGLITDEADRLHQLWGDVWEWTSSAYAPYPGFRPLDGALGEYNGKFMVNQLVVRGGSCATWAEHLRPSYRNFFYPHDRWQLLGIRLAKDLA